MKPTKFDEANKVLTAPVDSPDVLDLHVYDDGGMCVSCWQLSWPERFRLLFTGKVWFSAMGRTHPPVFLTVDKAEVICPGEPATEPKQAPA